MSRRIQSITLTDFRSIRGTVTTSLDAPIVLIHGPNGSGKTSILSGIELALTGHVPSLARVEPDYLTHLVHKQARVGKVGLATSGFEAARAKVDLSVDGSGIHGSPTLDRAQSRFYSERCYLAQSALGRLLEIYQHKDTRQTDSPLTQFVKDLLGLDRLDALIEGLHTAGDVRRLRNPVPVFNEAKEDIAAAENESLTRAGELSKLGTAVQDSETKLREALAPLGAAATDISAIEITIADLQKAPEEERLGALARMRRDIDAAVQEWRAVSATEQSEKREKSEQEASAVRKDLDQWLAGPGKLLEQIVNEVASLFADLQLPTSTNPEHSRTAAARAVEKELERCSALLDQDERASSRLGVLTEELAKAMARSQLLDQQIQSISANTGLLAQALAGLIPHIHSDNCPVCNRNFKEISTTPLDAFVSSHVAELTDSAGRLQALSKEKASAAGTIATLDRERTQLSARQISAETRNELKTRRARLSELNAQLIGLADQVAVGMQFLSRVNVATTTLDQHRSRDQRTTNLRTTIVNLAKALGIEIDPNQSIGESLSALRGFRDNEEQKLTSLQSTRRTGLELAREVQRVRLQLRQLQDAQQKTGATLAKLTAAKDEADAVIASARDLAHKARDVRTNIVRRVFNDSLNTIWRDLFVRLAPDEDFVPAFAVPQGPGSVEAVLETIYRAGGKGGNPRAMLSAGNLNTAALTLFLALHLSAKAQLPWLVIDDPVQSMDELHIAQFAVLLRTLSKGHHRQIILAVHERALFDYLALELSPAFQNDRLITVELGRAPDGNTTLKYEPHVFEPDRAIAA